MVSYTESRVSFAQISSRKTATKAWNWYQWWLSRKTGTNFRLEHSVQENFSTVTTAKVVFSLLSNRIFGNGFVNGKQARRNLLRAILQKFLRLLLSRECLNNLSRPQLFITNCTCTLLWVGALEYISSSLSKQNFHSPLRWETFCLSHPDQIQLLSYRNSWCLFAFEFLQYAIACRTFLYNCRKSTPFPVVAWKQVNCLNSTLKVSSIVLITFLYGCNDYLKSEQVLNHCFYQNWPRQVKTIQLTSMPDTLNN